MGKNSSKGKKSDEEIRSNISVCTLHCKEREKERGSIIRESHLAAKTNLNIKNIFQIEKTNERNDKLKAEKGCKIPEVKTISIKQENNKNKL